MGLLVHKTNRQGPSGRLANDSEIRMALSIQVAGQPLETPALGIAGWANGAPESSTVARRVLARFRPAVKPVQPSARSPADASETEILRLTAKGLSFDKVAKVLEISPHTVVAHVKSIYRKLAVHSRCEAVFEAGQLGLL